MIVTVMTILQYKTCSTSYYAPVIQYLLYELLYSGSTALALRIVILRHYNTCSTSYFVPAVQYLLYALFVFELQIYSNLLCESYHPHRYDSPAVQYLLHELYE